MTDGMTDGMTESPNVVIAQPKGCAIRKRLKHSQPKSLIPSKKG
jgi:hypothetical protein